MSERIGGNYSARERKNLLRADIKYTNLVSLYSGAKLSPQRGEIKQWMLARRQEILTANNPLETINQSNDEVEAIIETMLQIDEEISRDL